MMPSPVILFVLDLNYVAMVLRPCQLWCWGCMSFGLLGKGRGLSGQGLARIEV